LNIDVRLLSKDENIDLNSLLKAVSRVNERCGAIVLFIGIVKGLVEGNSRVRVLEYTSISNACIKIMEKIAREESEKYKLSQVTIWHRLGALEPGEVTVIIAVVAEDRKSAFRAAEEILERVKREAPIFKLEKRDDGEFWIIGDEMRVKREVK